MGLPSSTPYNLYKRHQPAERLPASLSPFSTKEKPRRKSSLQGTTVQISFVPKERLWKYEGVKPPACYYYLNSRSSDGHPDRALSTLGEETKIHDHVTVHVHLELVVPPQHLRRPPYVHRRVQDHLPPRHVGKELLTLVGQLQAAEPSREPEELAGVGRLGACLDGSRAEESAGVVDGHVGGGVVDGGHVGVGDVDGEDHLGVEEWEVELQG
ncbi:hypothetical protein BUALT_Bualt13G0058600 [Buddleja alternifolia]|uniref:Uncharacterized protein n=1 Tax=Buddleja alternifolia TaxID=168488 RepID=A0AAV6WKU3_9LAMI|nr:hypothetical protein BUALT_Bualt13G0058600 [Buddleja alternifolia]